MTTQTEKSTWNYGSQAKFYEYRPNYAPASIDHLIDFTKARPHDSTFLTADIGAGTGNLTLMLLERGLQCVAVEPTKEMREIGEERTKGKNVSWRVGTGESTTLDDNSVDLFAMGSSFNTTDREKTLIEAYRALKDNGFFCCMWNNRDIENDEVQHGIESIIESVIPSYERGTRREDQTEIITQSGLFTDLDYTETSQKVVRSIEDYINAWKSVKNRFWDVTTPEGEKTFEEILKKINDQYRHLQNFEMTYVTRMWIARKK